MSIRLPRRTVIRLLSVSALGGLAGCSDRQEQPDSTDSSSQDPSDPSESNNGQSAEQTRTVTAEASGTTQPHPTEWSSYQGTPQNTGYLPVESPVELTEHWSVQPEILEEYRGAESPTRHWYSPDGRLSPPFPITGGGRVYTARGSRLYAFDPASGEQLWEFSAPSVLAHMGAFYDESVYIRGKTSLYAVNAETGEKQWQTEVSQGGALPTVVDDIIYLGGAAYDVKNGVTIWEATHKRAWQTLSPTYYNGTVFLYGISGETSGNNQKNSTDIYAVDPKRGGPQWNQKFQSNSASPGSNIDNFSLARGHTPVISDGKAILAMDNAYVVAELWTLSVDSGEREKLFRIGDRRNVSGVMRGYRLIANPLAATPETVYFPTHVDPENSQKGPRNHILHAVDATTGTERWSYSFETSPRAPAVTDSAIYVPNGEQLFILDPEDGTYVTSVQLRNRIDPPMAVTSDRVYVTDKAGVLYALGK